MHLDAFDFFRWVVSIIATIYATVVTLQSLWGRQIRLDAAALPGRPQPQAPLQNLLGRRADLRAFVHRVFDPLAGPRHDLRCRGEVDDRGVVAASSQW